MLIINSFTNTKLLIALNQNVIPTRKVHVSNNFCTLLQCNPDKDWIVIGNGTFHISKEAVTKHGEIKCDVTPYEWQDDYSVRYVRLITSNISAMQLVDEESSKFLVVYILAQTYILLY